MQTNFTLLLKLLPGMLLTFLTLFRAQAQVAMTKEENGYFQNFNALPVTDTATWTNGTAYMPGWYIQRTKSTTSVVPNAGNSNTGGLYSYGATNAADRALGSISSLKAGEFAWGLLLQNTSGDTITMLDVSFYGEQWRISNKTAGEHQIAFYYAISSSRSAFTLSPSSDKNWTAVPELNFKSPKYYTDGGALNGNAAANRRLMIGSIPVQIPDGYYVMLRWKDADELEADHGLAIDDFSMVWTTKADQPVHVLPVELARFTAKPIGNRVRLDWQTATEQQNDFFIIERSADGRSFEAVGQVRGNGTTAQASNYAFADERPLPGTSYYRLKQVDFDGSYTYSATVAVTRTAAASIATVFPTTTEDVLEVEAGEEDIKQVLVLDGMGRQVWQQTVSAGETNLSLRVGSLRSGSYVLVLLDAEGRRSSHRFLKR